MKTYVDLIFAADGMNPAVVVDRLRSVAQITQLVGEHDLVFHWNTVEDFRSRVTAVHSALAGTGISYRLHTDVERSLLASGVGEWTPLSRGGGTATPTNPPLGPSRGGEERIP